MAYIRVFFTTLLPLGLYEKYFQRVDLLHSELELLDINYQTPFYAECILKYRKNRHKINFSVDNSCNSKASSTSNTLKQIYKGVK